MISSNDFTYEKAKRYRKRAHGWFAGAIFIVFVEIVFLFGAPIIALVLTIPVILMFRAGGHNLGLAKGIEQVLKRRGVRD